MDSFFKLIAAGPAFFVSAWLLMLFAGVVSTDVGVRPFGYLTSMVVTIALWLTVAPAIGAVARGPGQGTRRTSSEGGGARHRVIPPPGRRHEAGQVRRDVMEPVGLGARARTAPCPGRCPRFARPR